MSGWVIVAHGLPVSTTPPFIRQHVTSLLSERFSLSF